MGCGQDVCMLPACVHLTASGWPPERETEASGTSRNIWIETLQKRFFSLAQKE